MSNEPHRSGFVCFVGRPNTGKSTLTNALVGEKVAITSMRPQTTRQAIRGIVNRPGAQIVLVDTPGIHRPRTLLGERLNDLVRESMSDVDLIGFCLPAGDGIGPGDRFILAQIQGLGRIPIIAIVTKADTVDRQQLTAKLIEVNELAEFADIIPVSAKAGFQVDELADLLAAKLPEGPPLYPEGMTRDVDDEQMIAEFVREAALEGVREELPHSLAVVVEEILAREDDPDVPEGLLDVHVSVYVERPSQKAIIIGRGGRRLAAVSRRARPQIERLLGAPVYLDLHVRVAKDWQRDPKQLRKLGF